MSSGLKIIIPIAIVVFATVLVGGFYYSRLIKSDRINPSPSREQAVGSQENQIESSQSSTNQTTTTQKSSDIDQVITDLTAEAATDQTDFQEETSDQTLITNEVSELTSFSQSYDEKDF